MSILSLVANGALVGASSTSQFAFPRVESESFLLRDNSLSIYFDLVLDEKISRDDPRLKSVIYISRIYPEARVKVVFTNPNAKDLSEKLASILNANGAKVSMPQLVTPIKIDENTHRFVTLWIVYPKHNLAQTQNRKPSSKLPIEDK